MKLFMPSFSHYGSRSRRSANAKGALVCVAAAAMSVVAHAQSFASSFGSMDYSFSLDASSAGREGDLSISSAIQIYNLAIPFGSPGYDKPYTDFTGTGSASAQVGPASNYDDLSWAGNVSISSSAQSGTAGTAVGTVGRQENLFIQNNGSTALSFNISALAQISSNASITGTHSNSNFADVDTYIGFYDFDITNSTAISNPLLHITGSDEGTSFVSSGDWSLVNIGGVDYYQGNYTMTIDARGYHLLEFYTSSKDVASSVTPVPAPSCALAMVSGLVGLARRRRKQA